MCTDSVDLFSLIFLWMGWTLSTLLPIFCRFVVFYLFFKSATLSVISTIHVCLYRSNSCILLLCIQSPLELCPSCSFILCSLPSTWISSEQLQVFICSSLFYKPLSFTITLLTFHCLVFYENSFLLRLSVPVPKCLQRNSAFSVLQNQFWVIVTFYPLLWLFY